MNARCLLHLALAPALGFSACGGPDEGPVIISDPILPGGLEIRWGFELQDGTPTTCEAVEVKRTLVSVGGLPGTPNAGASFIEVPCGDTQEVRFDGLPTGPRPVVITALGADGDAIAEFSVSVVIAAEQRTQVDHTFSLSGTGPGRGDLRISWTIDRQVPTLLCAEVGGATVRVATTEGSIGDFDLTVACEDSPVSFQDLRRGTYFVRLTLQDSTGEALAFSSLEITVEPGTQSTIDGNFVLETRELARLVSRWTIGGVPPETACGDFGADEVDVRLQRFDPRRLRFVETTATATAACEVGRLELGTFSTTGLRRLAYLLVDTSIGDRFVLSSTVSASFRLEPGRTSTVTGDLPSPL